MTALHTSLPAVRHRGPATAGSPASSRRRTAFRGVITVLVFALVTLGCAGEAPPRPAEPDRTVVIPEAQSYVDAVNAKDLDALVGSFAEDGEVVDVQRTITGHDAIRAWADAEVIGGTLRVLSADRRRPDGQRLLVHWAPAGSTGWRAHYDLTVSGGKITSADLQYA